MEACSWSHVDNFESISVLESWFWVPESRAVIFACHCAKVCHLTQMAQSDCHLAHYELWHAVSSEQWLIQLSGSLCWHEMFINTTDTHTHTHHISYNGISVGIDFSVGVQTHLAHIWRHLAHWKSAYFQNCGTVHFTEDNSPAWESEAETSIWLSMASIF